MQVSSPSPLAAGGAISCISAIHLPRSDALNMFDAKIPREITEGPQRGRAAASTCTCAREVRVRLPRSSRRRDQQTCVNNYLFKASLHDMIAARARLATPVRHNAVDGWPLTWTLGQGGLSLQARAATLSGGIVSLLLLAELIHDLGSGCVGLSDRDRRPGSARLADRGPGI